MPALAGISHMPYRKFLFFNALGGIVWGVTFTTLGFQAGESYHRVEHLAGRGAAIAVAVVVVGLLVAWKIRSHRAEKDPQPAND
jgi:membrane protein DedA with SNARE-associated domain